MILTPYSPETARLLAAPPESGGGRHLWLFQVAARLIHAGADPDAVERRLVAYATARGWADRVAQIPGDVAKIRQQAGTARGSGDRPVRWPPVVAAKRRARAAFPPLFPPVPSGATAADALARLYSPDELICAGRSVADVHTMRAGDLAPVAAAFQFVVPNPMRAKVGRTADGRPSPRSKANAAESRRYCVVEFDTGDPLDHQAAVLSSLSSPAAPLVLAVYSGGKSVHGWFDVSRLDSPRLVFAWFAFAAHLGADASLWDVAKLVRMPGGVRENGKAQPILYLAPAAGEGAAA